MTIQQAWNERCRLYAEGNKLHAEGHKLYAEGDKLYAEGDKLYAEGHKLRAEGHKLYAEGDLIFIDTVIETHGHEVMIEYVNSQEVTVNGERYEYQQEKAEVVQEESSKVAIPDSKAFDANQLVDLVAQKVWEAMPKMVRLDYETREALNEYVRGKKDGAKEATELSEEQEKAAFNKGYRQGRSDRAREEISMPIATLIRQLPDTQVEGYFRHRGTICHKLWRCEPPMKCGGEDTEFVVSSWVVNPAYGSPTDLFAANSDGKVTCWAELGRGDYPEDAFRNVGYEAIVK